MAKLKIVKYGDPVLRNKTKIIDKITKDVKQLADDMLETMYLAHGAGLAGPQVGVQFKICVVDIGSNGRKNPFVLINPIIVNSENKINLEEGCLSFPGIFENVSRFDTVTVEYMDLDGNTKQIQARGFLAKAFQHEIDHLNGKLFIDYLEPWKRKIIEKDIKRMKKGGNW